MRGQRAFVAEAPGEARRAFAGRSMFHTKVLACEDAREYGPEKRRAGDRVPEGDRRQGH